MTEPLLRKIVLEHREAGLVIHIAGLCKLPLPTGLEALRRGIPSVYTANTSIESFKGITAVLPLLGHGRCLSIANPETLS